MAAKSFRLILILIFLTAFQTIFLPLEVFSYTSVNVPLGDPVYRIIDRLVAAGLVKNIVVGQRPYTRYEIASVLVEAKIKFEHLDSPAEKLIFLKLLEYWTDEYGFEIEEIEVRASKPFNARPLSSFDAGIDYLWSTPRGIPNNNFGGVDAAANPLIDFRGGRNYSKGGMVSFETEHWFGSRHFAFLAHPRLQGQISCAGFPETSGAYIQNLYAKAGVGLVELQVGRDELVWGEGEHGGLMFSNHARPVDMIKFSTLQPVTRPPWKYSILVANLGPEYNPKYAYLTGMKFSIQPLSFFELGLAYDAILGGRGGPELSFGEGAREFFGFIPGVSRGDRASLRLGGVDLRLRIPPASAMELYSEIATTGFDRERMAYLGGVYLPRLGPSDHIGIRGEYLHTPTGFYRSNVYLGGYSLSHEILGHPLGPGADAVYLSAYYDMGVKSQLKMDIAYERYKGAPSESRYRGGVGLNAALSRRAMLELSFGGEYGKGSSLAFRILLR